MSDYSDNDDNIPKGHIRLKEGIDMDALIQGRGETFEINFDSIEQEDDYTYNTTDVNLSELTNVCLGLDSDDNDDDIESDSNLTPFEKMALKMTNVTGDGKIKKKIKKEGTGSEPPENAVVSIHYSSFLEYNDEPTDYAYIKKQYQFRLGQAGICGLNFAVKSMKVNEKSWFLIHPDYAFGKMGHPPRIPPNATFLFQVELLRFVDSGAALQLDNMSHEEKRSFPNAYKTAKALIENAKEYFRHNVKLSIREYNKAKSLLEECTLSNMEEQEKQQDLLVRIYTNLAVCYTKSAIPKRACTMCNNIYAIARNTSIQIPAKVYFHNGRALLMLNEYTRARDKLLKAQRLEPHNKDISDELAKVFAKINEENKREREFAKAFLENKDNTNEKSNENEEEIDNIFRKEIKNLCKDLKENAEQSQFKLPPGLTEKEYNVAKTEAELAGLKFREYKAENDGKLTFYISKM